MTYSTPEYEWILCDSPSFDDIAAPLNKIGTFQQIQNRTFNPVKNRAGTASFQIRTNDELAYEILDNVDLGDIRGTVRKCIRIRRNEVDLWSGQIMGISGALDAGTLDISCTGWLEQLQYQMYWADVAADYSNNGNGLPADQIVLGDGSQVDLNGNPIVGLLNLVNAQDTAHPLWVLPGSVTGSMPILNRYYARGTMLGPALQEMSDVENGYDYEVDPVTRELNLTDSGLYTVQDNVILAYNWGPNNLKDFQWQEDPTQMIDNMYIQSMGSPVGPIYVPGSQDLYGNWSQLVQLTDANQGILEPYGVAQEMVYGQPLLTYTLLPHPRMNTDGPTLFDDYNIGDGIFFSAVKDCITIKRQPVRVFGATVSLDDNGNETVSSLQITPPSAGAAYTPPSS